MSSPIPRQPARGRASSQYSLNSSADAGNATTSTTAVPRGIPIVGESPLRPSLSSSAPHREPIRSFLHGSFRDHPALIDSAQNARSVRQDTAELASYILSDRQGSSLRSKWAGSRPLDAVTVSSDLGLEDNGRDGDESDQGRWSVHGDVAPSVVPEASEPPSPLGETVVDVDDGPSLIASMLRRSPASTAVVEDGASWTEGASLSGGGNARRNQRGHVDKADHAVPPNGRGGSATTATAAETTPLLEDGAARFSSYGDGPRGNADADVESQKRTTDGGHLGRWWSGRRLQSRLRRASAAATSKDIWNPESLWKNVVVAPVSCLPAVAVGLLLNILDGLSYGMILFPLGNPIFSGLGPAGMSMFYVSTIISQLVFSSGSIFRGVIGSELIEVVPFFHNMAATIAASVRDDGDDAIIATTIVSYAISAMVTGLVFYLMGRFHFGYVVGFIPRHILTGCIGGVGWFLVATGFEVSARLEGNLEYNLETLAELARPDKLPLWLLPLILAVVLFWAQSRWTSKYFLPLYILFIPLVFYVCVAALRASPDGLRDGGWIFEKPPAGEPWWYFYTLYQFKLVRWGAVAETIPAMLALTFFGILHVPINVPALARQCGEDHADLDLELRLHGYSNFVSGLLGSIQNYLVYSNTVFFMRSGGDRRLAGFMLAGLTALAMVLGPSVIGFIPVMMVATLIFDLGFELLLEALWEPRKKLRLMEYATVVAIVLVMGVYDFVIGIGIGILLAFVSLIVQSSRVSAVRSSYTGDIVRSTVRRNPEQHGYLQRAGRQIYIVKLMGYMFFGTIVSVEAKMRALLEAQFLDRNPIRYVVIDMWHVTGLDYSAGEGFATINRLLGRKGIVLVFSGVDAESELGRSLRMAGLGVEGSGVFLLPDLNSALESCENELLKTLYASELARGPGGSSDHHPHPHHRHLNVPHRRPITNNNPLALDGAVSRSPRQNDLREAAELTLTRTTAETPPAWRSFREPLRLMLHIFRTLSDRNEDFWFVVAAYFARQRHPPGTTLFRRGEPALGFYLVERGMLRAEYDLPQGRLWESIVAGTTCGELPFFSDTARTATVVVDRAGGGAEEGAQTEEEGTGGVRAIGAGDGDENEDGDGDGDGDGGCVLWLLDKAAWERMRADHPDVALELLTVSLKLTSERMSAITSYTLAMAG